MGSINTIWIVLIVILLLGILVYFVFIRGGGKLDILTSPIIVPEKAIGKSVISEKILSFRSSPEAKVLFETVDVMNLPLGVPIENRLESIVVSLGDPRESKPSSMYWEGGKFELGVRFYIHNFTKEPINLQDIKAHVYHVSMYRLPPANILYAPKVELTVDNSADLRNVSDSLQPGESQPIHLVFETSVFDTLFTVVVFGLVVDYSNGQNPDSIISLPSDHIYVFQHDHRWKTERAHFVSRDGKQIDQIQAETGTHQEFFNSLRRIYKIHVGQIDEEED